MKRLIPLFIIFLFLLQAACSIFSQSGGALARRTTPPAAAVTFANSGGSAAPTVTPVHSLASPTTPAPTAPAATFAPITVPNPGAPDVADYTIAVRLDPAAHHLSGRETITYRNTTRKPFADLVFHLYLNAFKSMDTVFMKESGGQSRGFRFDEQNNGWINVNTIQVKGGPSLKLAPVEDGTLAKAALPAPVAPGRMVELEVTFEAQLPQVFARTGWALDTAGQPFFLVGQWFPKLGVWTENGWNANIFHANAEFFADFGSYNIAITLPSGYVTGGVGLPQKTVKNSDGSQTATYQAAGVIDFAWVASPDLRTASRKVGSVEIVYFYLPEHEWSVQRELDDTEKSLDRYSDWYGPYPYARLSVVDVPDAGAGAGGMEYPTFVTIGAGSGGSANAPTSGWVDSLLITTAHEVAHQWWQSMVATDEADEPWLDEGFADTSTMLLLAADYGLDRSKLDQGTSANGSAYGYLLRRRSSYLRDPGVPMDDKSWDYNFNDYVIGVYAKPDMAMLTLEAEVGDKTMFAILRTYFERYRFAHPTTADFQKVAVQVSGSDLSWFFDGLVYHGETVNYVAKAINGDSLTVGRQGDLVVPVDVQVTFVDGTQQTVTWDGKESEHTFSFPKKQVKSFDIDPNHKLLIELDWKDNQISK